MTSKQEDSLTAVVIADSYTNNFHPLTLSTPHCLQNVAGRPLLDYTLSWLHFNSVTEVILYLSSSPTEVKTWLKSSKWSQELDVKPLNVTVIVNEDSRSVGDACRDLDEKGIVRGEFVLCQGDLVSNVRLVDMIEKHRERCSKDKNGIMTKLLMHGGEGDSTRCMGQDLVLATDAASGQILFHQRSNLDGNNFPIDLFQHEQVSVHSELADPGIYLCSPAVLAMFSDNFDKQDMDSLVAEILESDLVDYTIYHQIVESGTSVRASNPYLLTVVNTLILARWMYPIVPHPRQFKYSLGHVYSASNVKLGKGTLLDECVLISSDSVLGKNCQVTNTSMAKGCVIGDNCLLSNCVLEDGVTVGDDVVLNNVIVGSGCVIPDGVSMGEKVILGSGVELSPGVKIDSGARIVASLDDDWGDDGDTGEENSGDLGPKAFLYNEDDDDEEEDDDDLVGLGAELDPWGEVFVPGDDDDDDSSDDEDEDDDQFMDGNSSDDEAIEPDDDDQEHDDVKNFRREVMDSINRGLDQGVAPDNLVLEINGSKHAWNTTLSEVNQCVLYSVLTANITLENATAKAILPSVLKNIKKLSQLLTKYSKSKSGQQYYLEGLEIIVARHEIYLDLLPKILQTLNQEYDVIEDEKILVWNKKMNAAAQDPLKSKIVAKLKPFIEWLEQSDSEESDSE